MATKFKKKVEARMQESGTSWATAARAVRAEAPAPQDLRPKKTSESPPATPPGSGSSPVRQWLDSLAWDGVHRLGTLDAAGRRAETSWLARYLGAEDTDYTRSVGRWWLISAIARVFIPGCQAAHHMVLVGAMAGKTEALEALAGPWYANLADLLGPDDAEADGLVVADGEPLSRAWIVAVDMADGGDEEAASRRRRFMALSSDLVELVPAGRKLRQFVLCGTSPDPDFMKSESAPPPPRIDWRLATDQELGSLSDGGASVASRRYWPVRMVREADVELLKREREQLVAEAVAAFKADETWWPESRLSPLVQRQGIGVTVQIDGKACGHVVLEADATEEDARAAVAGDPNLQTILRWRDEKKFLFVPGRLVSLTTVPTERDQPPDQIVYVRVNGLQRSIVTLPAYATEPMARAICAADPAVIPYTRDRTELSFRYRPTDNAIDITTAGARVGNEHSMPSPLPPEPNYSSDPRRDQLAAGRDPSFVPLDPNALLTSEAAARLAESIAQSRSLSGARYDAMASSPKHLGHWPQYPIRVVCEPRGATQEFLGANAPTFQDLLTVIRKHLWKPGDITCSFSVRDLTTKYVLRGRFTVPGDWSPPRERTEPELRERLESQPVEPAPTAKAMLRLEEIRPLKQAAMKVVAFFADPDWRKRTELQAWTEIVAWQRVRSQLSISALKEACDAFEIVCTDLMKLREAPQSYALMQAAIADGSYVPFASEAQVDAVTKDWYQKWTADSEAALACRLKMRAEQGREPTEDELPVPTAGLSPWAAVYPELHASTPDDEAERSSFCADPENPNRLLFKEEIAHRAKHWAPVFQKKDAQWQAALADALARVPTTYAELSRAMERALEP